MWKEVVNRTLAARLCIRYEQSRKKIIRRFNVSQNMHLQCIEQYGQIHYFNVKLTLVPVRFISFSFISFVTNRTQYHQSYQYPEQLH